MAAAYYAICRPRLIARLVRKEQLAVVRRWVCWGVGLQSCYHTSIILSFIIIVSIIISISMSVSIAVPSRKTPPTSAGPLKVIEPGTSLSRTPRTCTQGPIRLDLGLSEAFSGPYILGGGCIAGGSISATGDLARPLPEGSKQPYIKYMGTEVPM